LKDNIKLLDNSKLIDISCHCGSNKGNKLGKKVICICCGSNHNKKDK